MVSSGVAKGRPEQEHAHPTHINCFPKSLACPVTEMKRLIHASKIVQHSIKTVSSSIAPTQLIQPDYTTDGKSYIMVY